MELNNFTLLILQRDRQYNLKQIGEYYKDLDCKKLIFDSSLTKYSNVSFLEECGFTYHYVGPMTYWEKLGLIHTSGEINTEFVLDNPDDDITFKPAIKECVKFLSQNPSYNSCSGIHYWYNSTSLYPHSEIKHLIALKYCQEDISDPSERIHNYLNRHNQGMLHDITRTSTLSSFYKMIFENEFLQRVNYIDRMYIAYAAMLGNKKTLPLGFQARSDNNNQRLITSHNKAKEALKEHVRLNHNLNFETLQPLSQTLANVKDISIEEAYKIVKYEFDFHYEVWRQGMIDRCLPHLDPNVKAIHPDYEKLTEKSIDEFVKLITQQ